MILSRDEVKANIKDSDGWKLSGDKWIEKHFALPSFPKALHFIKEIGDAAEDRDHHPYIVIDHKHVTLKLSTKDEGGLTQKDFDSAYAYDRIFRKYT
ncbi:4a-hydroxytetrahydrobiopterin dehydratase [Alkalicoccus urumqiensis]|uniref:4a-hydroxytetrahydrobiopterin dehydratase n=1 Tax=Alkalicoccus urumqiensis TaxID=1548213 RepID=A0A2P6MF40_ALKUR|nr:4a-hydroxytetrahydrobiopterin dehydratase [Alkalicoccus urumqiensis]PRO64867.1 hypothetical protein C6I21_12015 [Alkalicoccus urumqiensis]